MTLTRHRTPVSCVSLNKKSDVMVSASVDGLIVLWSITRLKDIHSTHIDGHPFLSTISDDGAITVAYFMNGFHIASFDPNLLNVHTVDVSNIVNAMISVYLPNNVSYVIASIENEGISVYETKTLNKVYAFDTCATALEYDKNNGILYKGDSNGDVYQIKILK
jgi:WD40 repeat protein